MTGISRRDTNHTVSVSKGEGGGPGIDATTAGYVKHLTSVVAGTMNKAYREL